MASRKVGVVGEVAGDGGVGLFQVERELELGFRRGDVEPGDAQSGEAEGARGGFVQGEHDLEERAARWALRGRRDVAHDLLEGCVGVLVRLHEGVVGAAQGLGEGGAGVECAGAAGGCW